jgi:hypothetical protein
MTSPARRSFERKMAAKAGNSPRPGALPSPDNGPAASAYQLKLAALGNDLRQLSNTQSLEKKIDLKRGMIDTYRPWIEGALAAEKPAQDEIVGTMLVWAIDIGEWPLALDIARHVLAHGLALPERYRRTPATLIAEEVAEAGIGATPTVDLATLQQVEAMTEGADMPDEVRAKVKKAIGLAFRAKAEAFDPTAESGVAGGKAALIAAAISHLERAVRLDEKCGVKKIIAQLVGEAKRLAEDAAKSAEKPA